MTPSSWQRGLSELVAAAVVTFAAAGAICTDRYSGGELGLLGTALAYALATAAMMSVTARSSAGHANPAFTLAAWLTRRIDARSAVVEMIAQLAGAALAGVVLARTFSTELWEPVSLGTPALGAGVSPTTGLFIEAVLTCFLVLAYLLAPSGKGVSPGFAGFGVGAALLCGILLGGPLTGASINPARAFGPALVSGAWSHHWIYWIGPLVGAILGTVAYSALRTDDSPTPAP